MQSANRSKNVAPVINVTPLIDVLLVLLIIFMIISPMRPNKFEARIPEKQDPDEKKSEDIALVVTINQGGGYALNMQPAKTLDELRSQLSRALDRRPTDLKS